MVLGVDPILLLLYILLLLLLYYIVLYGYYFDCILVPFGPPNFYFLTVYMSYICNGVVIDLYKIGSPLLGRRFFNDCSCIKFLRTNTYIL